MGKGSEACQHQEGQDVQILVARMSRDCWRLRQARHNEGKGQRAPEQDLEEAF
jgi:hypothetical protein